MNFSLLKSFFEGKEYYRCQVSPMIYVYVELWISVFWRGDCGVIIISFDELGLHSVDGETVFEFFLIVR